VYVASPNGLVQGLPLWMTDASVCRTVISAPRPYCHPSALLQLIALIHTENGADSTDS